MLKQLIQTNPSSLPQVLNLIGQQNPNLLVAIHQNEREFLSMMNEPITATNPIAPAQPTLAQPTVPSSTQIMQALASMPPAQRSQFGQSLGLSPEQLDMFVQMISQIPPDQLEQLMSSSANQGENIPPGTIALTSDEMESINRLMALGFSQQQAAQAFIACDRNETLAANFLFENGGFDDDDYDDGNEDMGT
jgi:UV excision repair protein RAD23